MSSTLSPVTTVKIAIGDGFGKMVDENFLATIEIGNGARNLQYAVVGSCGERHALHGELQHLQSLLVGFGILVYHALGHLRIAVYEFAVLIALLLYLTGTYNALAYVLALLALLRLRDITEGHRRDLYLQVDAVHEGSADAAHVALYLSRRTHTVVGGVAMIAARTWVHGCNKHERARELQCVFGTRDCYLAVFQRLAEQLQCCLVKLGQLVKEEHSIMGKAYLSRLWSGTAADKCHLGNSMVR